MWFLENQLLNIPQHSLFEIQYDVVDPADKTCLSWGSVPVLSGQVSSPIPSHLWPKWNAVAPVSLQSLEPSKERNQAQMPPS